MFRVKCDSSEVFYTVFFVYKPHKPLYEIRLQEEKFPFAIAFPFVVATIKSYPCTVLSLQNGF